MEYVYCGGRFDFDYLDADFEKKAEEDYRAILLNDVSKLLRNSGTVILSSRMAYIGPYYFESDGMLDRDIVETESALCSPFWYPMILCKKIDSADVDIVACDSLSQAHDEILKWLKDRF